jgi:hypothetical protein
MVQDCRVGDAYVPGDFLEPDRIGAALGQKPLGGVENFFSRDFRASTPPRNRRPGGLGTFCHAQSLQYCQLLLYTLVSAA